MIRVPFLVLGLALAQPPAAPAADFADPWQEEYRDRQAKDPAILGLWQFNEGAETQDSSGRGHTLKLEGAKIGAGKFGTALEGFRGWPVADKRHAAMAASTPALSPSGAFTLELWIHPKKEFEETNACYLLDKKYVSNNDYQLQISAPLSSKRRSLHLLLGFANESESFFSEEMEFPIGRWQHVAVTYDGRGTVRFYRDGQAAGGQTRPGRHGISAGSLPLSIGDRVGSHYNGFPGFIDQVRLSTGVREFRRLGIMLGAERTSYRRLEKEARVECEIRNFSRQPIDGLTLRASLDNWPIPVDKAPPLAPGMSQVISIPLDTTLRPGQYELKVEATLAGETPLRSVESLPITLVARPRPHRMPVVMWGIGSPEGVLKELPRLKELGFTHALGFNPSSESIWKAQKPISAVDSPRLAAHREMFNTALAHDFGIVANVSPASWLKHQADYQRLDRQGKPYARQDVDALIPELRPYCFNVGASIAQTFGKYPALDAALVHTEVRDDADLSFRDLDREAYRKATGQEIPPEVMRKWGLNYRSLKGFPADRVIADDDPIYRYYQWFWKEGDGWNALNTEVHRGLHSTGRTDLWTFHDPAVRVASVHGSGGNVDFLSQWTYSYPDPLRIGIATDELLAMARGASHPQQVMKMTQIIWYRSQTAPAGKAGLAGPRSPWDDNDPGRDFITIAPVHLRQAFWTKLARPIQGIMYHGWQSLVPTDSPSVYRYTHPQTQHVLRRLVREVVEPLGPTLRQIPAVRSDVGFLQSFASQMFAGRGTYGWGHSWAGDAHLILQHAQVQPEILYEETVRKAGLDQYKVLCAFDCDVLPRSVVQQIQAFQKRGGILLADESLCPALKADIVLPRSTRTQEADRDRAKLLEQAATLRKALDSVYPRYADVDTPDIVAHRRRANAGDYLFTINDRREFGDYVGQYGLVMENGLPSEGELRVRRPNGVAYDLTTSRRIEAARTSEGMLRVPVWLGPGEGRVFLVLDQPIAKVQIQAPAEMKAGNPVEFSITVADARDQPTPAVIPLHVELLDPDGRRAEPSGHYGAVDGRLALRFDPARNDVAGVWQLRVNDLASGQRADHFVRLLPSVESGR